MRTLGENTELMLFDYLEGNYSEDQLRQIEKKINGDPQLAEELEIWQSSKIESDFYETAELESELIRTTVPSFNFRYYLNAVLLIGMAVFTGTNSKMYEMSEELVFGELPSVNIISPKINFEQESVSPELHIQKIQVVTKAKEKSEVIDFEKTNSLVPKRSVSVFGFTALELNESSASPRQIPLSSGSEVSAKDIRKAERKEEKANRKMRKKAHQKRTAVEFMKGNVPYVVPIDTDNF